MAKHTAADFLKAADELEKLGYKLRHAPLISDINRADGTACYRAATFLKEAAKRAPIESDDD
jgi:hypothetical protein